MIARQVTEEEGIRGNMNTKSVILDRILNLFGLQYFDLGFLVIGMVVLFILLLILFILLLLQMKKVKKLNKRLDALTLGKDGSSLEQDIVQLFEDNKYFKEVAAEHKKDIRTLFKRMESAYQKFGLVKYDAFNQMGGQLSFCLVLLDENNNGFLLNSVHSSEGCYSYTKEIRQGESDISLGAEETEALQMAMGEPS